MNNLNIMKYLFLSLAIIGIHTTIRSQKQTAKVLNNSYFENFILNTDRELYIAGEKIWFKVSCIESETNNEIIHSKIVYLELYDNNKNTVTNGKFRIINGKATGYLSIPKKTNSGSYYLRVYTQFMRNYSSYLYPTTIISIANPNRLISQNESKASNAVSVVPKGGKLIAEIPAQLAVRIKSDLQRKLIKSTIIDNNKNVLVQFSSSSNGLALVEFTPKSSAEYFVKLTFNDSSSILKPLPPVLKSGILLKSSYTKSGLKLNLISNILNANKAEENYKLILKSENYKNLLTRNIIANEPIEIWSNLLTKGIIYILVKNKDNELVDISSVFIPENPSEEIKISKNKDIFNPRELVELNVDIPNNNSDKSNLIITVTKLNKNHFNSKNLLPVHITYNPVLLSNYLKNNVVINDSLKKQINIALVLYTPIYNSNSFIEGIQKNKLNWFPEIRDVSLTGSIINKTTNKPLSNVMVYGAVFGNKNQLHLNKTDANGKFYFSLNHLSKKQNIFIGIKPIDSVQIKILINNDFSNDYPLSDFIPFDLDSSNHIFLEQLYRNAQVNKSFYKHVNKTKENISYHSLVNAEEEISILLKDFIYIPVMAEVMDEIVPFVTTRKKQNQYYLNVFNDKTGEIYNNPLVLLDGVPVFDINKIMKISPELIQKISVIKTKYHLGNNIINGIIKITTKAKDFAGISFPNESAFIEYQTITTESYPIFPEYKSTTKKDRIPDFRNLLYWNPYLLQKTEKIEFYTSDDYGNYEITIKGYNKSKLFYGKTQIKIEKNIK